MSISDVEPAEDVELFWEDVYSTYIEQIMKKVRVGEQDGLEKAISQFPEWLSGEQI